MDDTLVMVEVKRRIHNLQVERDSLESRLSQINAELDKLFFKKF